MPRPEKWSILIARFPGGSLFPVETPECVDYIIATTHALKTNPECKDVLSFKIADTPITMGRNRAVAAALATKVDFLMMLDNDMWPDVYYGRDPFAEPMVDSSIKFMLDRWDDGPHVIGAPYCGPPPIENVFVFRWTTQQTDDPNPDYKLDSYTREEVVQKIGFEKVAALPTGHIIYDMRCYRDLMKPPYFYYEWKTPEEMEKASTEDVTNTRDLSILGAKVWVNWSAWAGHWKLKLVGKPKLLFSESVGGLMRKALEDKISVADRKIVLGPDGGNYMPPRLVEAQQKIQEILDAKSTSVEGIRRVPKVVIDENKPADLGIEEDGAKCED